MQSWSFAVGRSPTTQRGDGSNRARAGRPRSRGTGHCSLATRGGRQECRAGGCVQNTPLGQGGTKGTHHGGLTVVSAGSRWREEGNFSHGQGGSTGTYHRGPTVVPTTPGG